MLKTLAGRDSQVQPAEKIIIGRNSCKTEWKSPSICDQIQDMYDYIMISNSAWSNQNHSVACFVFHP